MNEYFKYCSVEQLKQEIKSRLAGAKLKLDLMNSRRTAGQSVDRKFYDYVSEIKCKQKQYEATISESSQLNSLLRKRRNKINESLDKYQRNIKYRTLTDFKISNYNTQKPLISHHLPRQQHTLLNGRTNQLHGHPRSKTEANFFTKPAIENEPSLISNNTHFKQNTDPSQRNLRSITKVFNITVGNSQMQDPTFSFADKNNKISDNVLEAKRTNAAKKKIRFDTTPSQIFERSQPKKKNNEQLFNSIKEKGLIAAKIEKKSARQTCIQKIKQRIYINYQQRRTKRMTTKELHHAFEDQSSHRMVLLGLISSAAGRKHY